MRIKLRRAVILYGNVFTVNGWVNRFLNSTSNSLNDVENINKLVLRAQSGDEDAFNSLVKIYEPVIYFKANKFKETAEAEDLVQDGLMALWGAVQTYDQSKGAAFKTYANRCIDNRIFSGISKVSTKKSIPKDLLVYLDGDETVQAENSVSPEQSIIDRESYITFVKNIKNKLSDMELAVLSHHTSGKSYRQIADILHTEVKAVDNAIQRIRKKLRNYSI